MTKESRLRPLVRAVLRTQSDERLVSLAREGREAAFEEIVRRYRPGLVAFAAAFAPAGRAEDVVQESLVRSWAALEASDEDIDLKPWLYTIVRNRALNARRDAKIHAPLTDEIDGVPQPPELVLRAEELATVVSAVRALPDTQREALVQSALDGHTHEQIASALGFSPGAVRQLIYRARVNLRSGVGMLIPLPLVRMLTEHGGAGGEAAATGIAFGGVAAGAAGGASVASKLGAIAIAGAIAAGAGVAIDRSNHEANRDARQVVAERSAEPAGSRPTPSNGATITPIRGEAPSAKPTDSSADAATADRSERGEGSEGADSAGSGDSGEGGGAGPSDDASGPGGGDSSESSGGDDEADDDHSGPGGSGSGDNGSDNSGSGGSGSGSTDDDDPPKLDEPEDDLPELDESREPTVSDSSGSGSDLPDPLDLGHD